jgi:DNA-binding NarL/FixJ family response regulator
MAAERRIRVLCVDDNPLVADAVATRLRLAGGFDCVGHLPDASALVREAMRLKPHVVLMDLDMPGAEPFEMMRDLSTIYPDARVLILSGHVRRELLDGAWGYLSKNDDAETLVAAIRRVADGEFVLGPELASDNLHR